MSAKSLKSTVIFALLLLFLGGGYTAYRYHFVGHNQDSAARGRGGLTEEERDRVTSVRDALGRILTYAGDHQDEFPTTVGQLGQPTPRADGRPADWSGFEFVGPRHLREVTDPSTTVILQEKQVDQNGRRVRGYADGHSAMER